MSLDGDAVFGSILVCFLLVWQNTMNKSNLGRKRACFCLQLIVYHEWNSRQEFASRVCGRMLPTGLFPMACSSYFLIQLRTYVPLTVGWALSHQSLIKQISQRFTYRPIWWKYFLNWSSLFPDDPGSVKLTENLTIIGDYRGCGKWGLADRCRL